MPTSNKINVNIIKVFEGPRHYKLEEIWDEIASRNRDRMNLHIYDNTGARRSHADAYEEIWKKEIHRKEEETIFTEFDFLPEEGFLEKDTEAPIEAATYVTRNPQTKKISTYGTVGAWFIRISKPALREYLGSLEQLYGGFLAGGHGNDPGGRLLSVCPGARLLGTEDCYPEHFGARVVGRGQHLFWSRHYGDPPGVRRAGFAMSDIHKGVDRAIESYEKDLQTMQKGTFRATNKLLRVSSKKLVTGTNLWFIESQS